MRGPKTTRSAKPATKTVKKLAVTLPDGATPSIGDTLTPVKATKTTKATTKTTKTVAKKVTKEATDKVAPKVEKKPAKKAVAKKAVAETPVVAVRRSRQPVNPEETFAAFVKATKIGAKVEGEVMAFTSHGAVIKVALKNGSTVECYAPTTNLGTPAPARARDVLKRGDVRTFVLSTVDSDRRIAELGL